MSPEDLANDRARKQSLIKQIAADDPNLTLADLSYNTTKQDYQLTEQDAIELIKALQKNNHLKVLNLNRQEILSGHLIKLAKAIANKKILGLYICLNNIQQNSEFVAELFPANKTLVRLVLNSFVKDLKDYLVKNAEEVTARLAKATTRDEFMALVAQQEYILCSSEFFTGKEYINVLNRYEETQKEDCLTTLYEIRQKFVGLRKAAIINSNNNTAARMEGTWLVSKEFEQRVQSCTSLEALKKLLPEIKEYPTSHHDKKIPANNVIILIDRYLAGEAVLAHFPRIYGIRNKIGELGKQLLLNDREAMKRKCDNDVNNSLANEADFAHKRPSHVM